MFRSGYNLKRDLPMFKSSSKLGIHLSTYCSRDERLTLPSPGIEPGSVVWKRDMLPLGHCDEAHFWLNGHVNKQNCRIWNEANPQLYVETPLHPEKLTVWCALWAGGIIGPYFFKNDEGQHTFGDRLISRFGPVNWLPISCDLTPLDYFLWGYVKSLVYADKPQTLDHLEDNIFLADIRPQMLEKVIENWTSRLDYIRASRGSPMPEIIFKM
ncbi:putative DD41D transposase [Trichonephila clavipes]|nr:putative DD41D transposase [Trichonephila clavipes]